MTKFSPDTGSSQSPDATDIAAQLARLSTEMQNPASAAIDTLSAQEIVELINDEDATVAAAVRTQSTAIARVVSMVTDVLRRGGSLLYVGAGTSGRLGIVDASEMPPTFGTDPAMVQALIAGGVNAVFAAQEGAEDQPHMGASDVDDIVRGLQRSWIVIGIAASGRTPYVIGALARAHELGYPTAMISTNSRDVVREFVPFVDEVIAVEVGPEVITGSTRMKSGTAQKMVLNMITTSSMVLLGKTLGNIMVDLQQTNAKLAVRAKRIVSTLGNVDADEAERLLKAAEGSVKFAIVMARSGCTLDEAKRRVAEANGFIRNLL